MSLQARSTVGITCAGPVHWTVYVPVTVESKIDVLVLTHAVNRDARLTAADVTVETRNTAGPGNAYLTKPTELGGRTVRRPLAAGTTLSVDMFTPDMIVRRGQQVTLLSSAVWSRCELTGAQWWTAPRAPNTGAKPELCSAWSRVSSKVRTSSGWHGNALQLSPQISK